MKAVFKYVLRLDEVQSVYMPRGARILTIQLQGGFPCIWAEVDSTEVPGTRKFYIIGTGNPFPEKPLNYVGTVQDGRYVWHIYEAV